jgi:hypothetical protein
MPSWKFLNPRDREAAALRREMEYKIDAWWLAFKAKAGDMDALFRGRTEWDLAEWMHDHLGAVDKRIMWEFGPCDGGHRLVLTPEVHRNLRPMVETMLERAPRLPGWSFAAYRSPESMDAAREMVLAKTNKPLPDTVTVRASVGELNRVDLVFESKGFPRSDRELAAHQAFTVAESLLGEEVLDKWIHTINVSRARPDKHSLPPERLKRTVDALVLSIRDQLPGETFAARKANAEWAVLELEPDELDEYPWREDIITFTTMNVPLFAATVNDVSFYSERFSRCGERFAFLKIDGRGPDATEMKFADRAAIEAAADAAVLGIGCVVGGGTGRHYSYIDLALTDVDRAIAALKPALRNGAIPKRAWLLFHDCEWRDEWVGMYDDTPPPPAPVE